MKALKAAAFAWLTCYFAYATVVGSVRGIVHDPQHRPVAGSKVMLKSTSSDFQQAAETDRNGTFEFLSVPLGDYRVEISSRGFQSVQQKVFIASGSARVLHYELALETVQQQVNVSGTPSELDPESATPETVVSRAQISQAPGADRTNSLAFITDFVPGAYVVHDQLHVRGGHQVSWAINGIAIPNTNIATNVGPQFDPKDIDYLEVQRGGYSAEYGDRTYGVFNVATRTGFERTRQGELVASYGNHNQTDNQISFGDHTSNFAYYASANGNRSDYGLETPTSQILHDQASGGGAFTSLIYNRGPNDQFRLTAAVRSDFYQVPNDLDAKVLNVRDREREQDAFGVFSWTHTAGSGTLITVSPFYHFNRAAFEGGVADVPISTNNRRSDYIGGQASMSIVRGRNNAQVGIYGFAQRDNTFLSVIANDGSGAAVSQRDLARGSVSAAYVEEQFKATSWLTLNGGARFTHFSGALNEDSVSPRVGAAIRVPRLNWVFRGSYSRYYQAPPLTTVAGPLVNFAAVQGFGFLPLKGELDEQQGVGVTVPLFGWFADMDYFRTGARNFFDHDVIGNSNVFFPLTLDHARIRGVELTVRSPRLFNRADFHLAYSHQSAEANGARVGGLTNFNPPANGSFYLDHDQRHTLSSIASADLPWRTFISAALLYGSGFLNGNGPSHLPDHVTLDLAVGKSFGEKWSAKLSAVNVANKRYQLDLSNTFGGSHFADPRMVTFQVRYRFHY